MRKENEEYDLLRNPSMTKRFNSSFSKVQGHKVNGGMTTAIIGSGKMIGDEDVIRGGCYQFTMTCLTQTGRVMSIKREEFLKIKQHNEEGWAQMVRETQERSKSRFNQYCSKVAQKDQLNKPIGTRQEMHTMCNGIMREQLWA